MWTYLIEDHFGSLTLIVVVEKLGYLRWFQKSVPVSEDSGVILALLCCPQLGFDIECPR